MSPTLIRFFTEDKPVFVMIALNAVVLFLLAFPALDSWHNSLEVLDAFFLAYFILEALLKIRQYGWRGYISSKWNRFDFLIVLLSFPSIMLLFQPGQDTLTTLFIFRIARVVRFFKFMRFIPNIGELLSGIRRAFKASLFVLLAFSIFLFVIALISCRIFGDMAPELFGDPLISVYSIFQVFTIEGWNEIPEAMIDPGNGAATNFLIRFYFVTLLTVGGLFGLSIVNAIFVEEMVRDNNDDIRLRLEELHNKIDGLTAATGSAESGWNPQQKPPK